MTQCAGTTQKGDRCKREARNGSACCSIHQDQETRKRADRTRTWDADAILKAAVGCVLVVAIVLLRIRR
jgi:hypothetical protein